MKRYGFVLMAPTHERHHVRVASREPAAECPQNRALPDARLAGEVHDDRTTLPRELQQPSQCGELWLPSDEGLLGVSRNALGRLRHCGAKPFANGCSSRSLRRIEIQQFDAQLPQIGGNIREDCQRRRCRLVVEPLLPRGNRSGERLKKHHAETVPISGGIRRNERKLFRGHVGRRTREHHALHAADLRLTHESKIQKPDPPVGRHEDVSRLDVAVEDAPRVQRRDALRKLQRRSAKSLDVTSRTPGRVVRLVSMLDILEKVDATNQFHREKPQLALAEQLVQFDKVGMANVDERTEFAFEPIQECRICSSQDLQGDQLALVTVVAFVHLTEPPGA